MTRTAAVARDRGNDETAQHKAHRDFAMGLLDALKMVVTCCSAAPALPDFPVALRDALAAAKRGAAESSEARALAVDEVWRHVNEFVELRDAVRFDKTVELARDRGKLAAELTGTAH